MNYVKKLEEMKNMNMADIDPDSISEMGELIIDSRKYTPIEWLQAMIEQGINPYIYKDHGVIVKVSFANNGKTLQSCMEDYLRSEILLNNPRGT